MVATLVLVLSGCGGSATTGGVAGEPPAATSSAAPSASTSASANPSPSATLQTPKPRTSQSSLPSPKPVEVADTLRFEATTVDGKPFDAATMAGKPVLLWFWAPWCPTCKAQIPEVQKLAKTYEGRVNVIGVGSLDGGDAIKLFADDAWGMTHLTDEQGQVWKHFGVVEQSSFLLLDATGEKAFSAGYGGSDRLPDEVARVAG